MLTTLPGCCRQYTTIIWQSEYVLLERLPPSLMMKRMLGSASASRIVFENNTVVLLADGAIGGGQDCSAAPAPTAALAAQGGSALHLANSPYGPWVPFEGPLPPCNNPTQMRHPNGTWFLVCNSNMLYRGPNVTGPWDYVLNIPSGRTPGIFEDGFLYQDGRGNWHQFFHTYTMTCDTPRCDPTAISGHSFSADGLRWYSSCVQPYFNTANVTDGSTVRMSTRERPKLIFGADGEPVALSNGVCPMPNSYPQAAIQCKVQGVAANQGYWTHTLVQELDYS
jgi:hypothetical protein